MAIMYGSSDYRERQRPQRLLSIILCVALCARALIPLGYMPGDLLNGSFVELCPTSSPALADFLAADGQHSAHGAHSDHDTDAGRSANVSQACPIGLALSFAALIALPDELFAPSIERELLAAAPPQSFVSVASNAFRARAPPTGIR